MKSINKRRIDYSKGLIEEDNLLANPIETFKQWMSSALTYFAEPNAFVLSTVNVHNEPSSRVLLLRDVTESGFVFYTNYLSQKGQDIAQNPKVSMNFFWPKLEQQIRINGNIEKVPDAISDTYFQSRPYESRIGAWSSPQSQPIESRQILDDNVSHFTEKFSENVPRPPHWGGYIVSAQQIEFWQGRSNRLHDRILYEKNDEAGWVKNRLAP
ncbi:MAG: pyridoxamine 5'-phosphate oxidase [Bacteroidota bacterium]|nr:pyridoxamine 5'-phosphate oxidase [Bacteroidota bacterium]